MSPTSTNGHVIGECGEAAGVIAGLSSRTVTERRDLSPVAADQRTRIQMALAAARVAVWELDDVSGRLHGSDNIEALWSRTAVEMRQSSGFPFVHPEDLAAVNAALAAARAGQAMPSTFVSSCRMAGTAGCRRPGVDLTPTRHTSRAWSLT